MLAKHSDISTYPVLASTKYDGVRVIAIVENGLASLYTRNGKLLEISSLIGEMQEKPEGVYDGELVAGNGKQNGRTKITGDINKVLKGSLTDISEYSYCIFDYISLETWRNKSKSRPYSLRLSESITKSFSGGYARIVSQEVLNSDKEVQSLFNDLLKRGYEGLILRYPEDIYEWKRTPRLIKKKAIHTATLICEDIDEGSGKYSGMIGSLYCQGLVDNKAVEVFVGTGLSDFDRDLPPEEYVGKRIEVEYNDIVLAKDADNHSLFLPVFKRIVGNV